MIGRIIFASFSDDNDHPAEIRKACSKYFLVSTTEYAPVGRNANFVVRFPHSGKI